MTTAVRYKLAVLFIFAVTVVGIVFTAMPSIALAESGVKFENTDVLDDLASSVINGKKFDLKNYPYDEEKQAQVLSFTEYCYSYRANRRGNYGLYVYVYNPQGLNISVNDKGNKIQMAVGYDEEGRPSDYAKFRLLYCDRSDEADYKNLFYKFKIEDVAVDGKTFADRVNSNERRYDVSGIELTVYGEKTAAEYAVNATYKFSGYAEGYGPDQGGKSTLKCNTDTLETITLDVKHTFYRTKTSSKGAGYQNQLDTVYFAVPRRFFDTYGTLQRIKAEWYEYKTKDIVVTSNKDFYNAAIGYVGVETGYSYNSDIGYSLGQDANAAGDVNTATWGWNLGTDYLHPAADALYYLFKTDDIEEYDPYADVTETGGVSSNALYDYICSYNKTYNCGSLPIKDGSISADLFESDIDDYRKKDTLYGKIQNGYSYYDFDADLDLQYITSWQDNDPSFWDNWMAWGLWDTIFGNIPTEESKTLSPIHILQQSDLSGSDEEISERLMVNYNDVRALKEYYDKATSSDEPAQVVLFRFAATDYYSAAIDIMELRSVLPDKKISGQAYRASESVFFDFDVIQLTFRKDGTYAVIPAVSSPLDIVNDITPPVQMPSEWSWWQIILALAALMLLLIILLPFLPMIVRLALWTVLLPFRLIGAVFKRIGKAIRRERK